ncbi:TrmH family RNA methyltransferase [Candidatus Gracilibacteria bacterium]|nr:TrmH family RNA methyltransferase [Candidatus Gracilibacteria bacterium]
MRVVVLENIRSAYNVGNIIRTADALGWKVWICGYTPDPGDHKKVVKTSLGAENEVGIKQFDYTNDVIKYAKENNFKIIAAEISEGAIELGKYSKTLKADENLAVIFGNEVDGVMKSTLEMVDNIVYISMKGIKESLNVGQTSAIFMRELNN